MLSKEEAVRLIMAQGGRIFRVKFVKKDGSEREMVCRREVKSHLKGGTLPYNPADYGLVTVFDMQKKAYRSINTETLLEVTACGETHEVIEC